MSTSKPSGKTEISADLAAKLGFKEGKCASCGARILWAVMQTKAGTVSRVPLQPRAIATYVVGRDQEGNYTGLVELRKGFESHFADCPNAKSHRKEKS